MVEVVGRPVFLMQGLIPVYRDLRPGAEGIDVLQFEEALARLGFLSEAPDEVWASATGAAVQAFYDQAGYRANAADESELAALDSARERVRLASSLRWLPKRVTYRRTVAGGMSSFSLTSVGLAMSRGPRPGGWHALIST